VVGNNLHRYILHRGWNNNYHITSLENFCRPISSSFSHTWVPPTYNYFTI